MTAWRWLVLVATAGLVIHTCRARPAQGKLATFNIEEFPKDARQIDGAFAEIARLGAGFVAVQEINDPELFAATARRDLGERWDFVSVNTKPLDSRYRGDHIGVLYDGAVWTLRSTAVHDETRLDGRQKPTFEVRLQGADGAIVRIFVVHLKAGGEFHAIRTRQYAALTELVRAANRSGDRIVLLGDFNATGEADRVDLAALAAATGLRWATETLACSAFWSRDDGCPTSRLDHVLTSLTPSAVEAGGACATHGCDWRDSCPLYADEISDHCPVVVTY